MGVVDVAAGVGLQLPRPGRADSVRRSVLPAVFFIMVTVALHFETGYLAFVPLVVWPFIVPSDLWRRIGRAVVGRRAALLASAWVVVPVLAQSHWAARNQVLEGTGLENGYGARQILDWLFTGRCSTPALVPRHHDLRRRRHRGVRVPMAHLHRRPRPGEHLRRHHADDIRAHDVRCALRRSSPGAPTSSSGASRWACNSRGSCSPGSASASSGGLARRRRNDCCPSEPGVASRTGRRAVAWSAALCIVAARRRAGPGLDLAWTRTTRTTPPTSACRRPTTR